MGQPVTVIERPTGVPGIHRYETNRVLSGMGHDRYTPQTRIQRSRPVDVLARRLFARGGIASVHVNGNTVTVEIATGDDAGIQGIIEGLYTYYGPGVVVAVPEG